jgi:imidazole glycerol phosphate synthase subunit HisF
MLTGGSQEMVADAFDAIAVTLIGADGAAFIATLVDALDAAEVPALLVAVILKV